MSIRVVAGAIWREGLVLAAQRPPGKREAGLWELPGGKVEQGESDRAALQRELAEELGVDVTVHEHVATHTHSYPHGAITLVLYRCTTEGDPQALEHAALRWVDPAAPLRWAPADIPLVARLCGPARSR